MSEHNIGESSLVEYGALNVNSSNASIKNITLLLLRIAGVKDLSELLTFFTYEENRQLIINSISNDEITINFIVDVNLSYKGLNSIAIEFLDTYGAKRMILGIPSSETIINYDKSPELKNLDINVNPPLTTPIKSTVKSSPISPSPTITTRPSPQITPIASLPLPQKTQLNPPLTTPIQPTQSKTDQDPVPIVDMNNHSTMTMLGVLALVVVGTLIVLEVK